MQQKSVVDKVGAFLTQNDLLGKTFIVGFSGGYDSMCLLHTLSSFDVKFVATHFNHGWRIEADDEEQVCKDFCLKLGIEFYSERASNDLKKSESVAREARYDFFNRACCLYSADGIFTAHNSDDNAETLIYRIAKGTGIYGLKGISANRDNIWRPLLNCTREEIEQYCLEQGLVPNVDSSNSDVKYRRNFIRHEILPKLQEINPEIKSAINSLSELAELEECVVEEYLSLITSEVVEDDFIYTQKFLKLSTPVKQRLLYSFLKNYLQEYSLKKVVEVLDFILKNSTQRQAVKMSLTTARWLSVNEQKVFIYSEKDDKIQPVIVEGEGCYSFADYTFELKPCDELPAKFPSDKSGVAYVDLSDIEYPIEIRFGNLPKDKIIPFGMSGRMVLKKYLSGKSIPQHLRGSLPVLALGNSVLWIPNVGLSADVAVKTKPTHIFVWH